MPISNQEETSIGATAFKAQCLGLIDEVAQGKTSRITLTKHIRPVAAIVPIAAEPSDWISIPSGPLGGDARHGNDSFRRRYYGSDRRNLGLWSRQAKFGMPSGSV